MADEAIVVRGIKARPHYYRDLEWFMAELMKAMTIEIDAGHLSLVSHALDVVDLILKAAALNNR